MHVLVDTCIWSLALRRHQPSDNQVAHLIDLIKENRVKMIGPIRQELLSGIREAVHFNRLKKKLSAFPDLIINTIDHEQAADFFNQLRKKGIQSSSIDCLICAAAFRYQLAIYTSDRDFIGYQKYLPIQLLPNPLTN